MEVRGLEGETGGEPHDCPEEWWEVQVQPRVGNRGLGSQRGEGRDTLAVYHRAQERTEPHGAKLPGVPLGSRVGAEHSPRVKKCPSPELEKEPPKD